jgi:hypothetical protein
MTYSDGGIATVQTTYSQKFTSFYSTVETPPSGSVGLGTISGSVGVVRTNNYVTVSNGVQGVMGTSFVMLIGLLLL